MKQTWLMAMLLFAGCAHQNQRVASSVPQACPARGTLAVSNRLPQSIDVYVNTAGTTASTLLGEVLGSRQAEFKLPARALAHAAYARISAGKGQSDPVVARSWREASADRVKFEYRCLGS